jgi:penicillin-binding protein 1A
MTSVALSRGRPAVAVPELPPTRIERAPSSVPPRNVKTRPDDAHLPTARAPRRFARSMWKWAKRIALASLLLLALGVVGVAFAVRHYEADLPSVADLKSNYHPPQVTRVLARDGTPLAELFTERRTVVSIGSLPPHVKLAFLAAEDANFYEHAGVNYFGILRAIVVNFRAGRTRQGGSTITQQVIKNLYLSPERTYKRKIQEALLARKLEQELTKDEILELYVNHIYMGRGRWGVEEAARDNFGKPAHDLSIAEAALLAGIVANPERYTPRRNMSAALARRAYVLSQMHEKGFLNDAQFDAAKDEAVRLAPEVEPESELAPEVVEIARRTLEMLEKDDAKLGGYTITTSIDPRLQAAARKAVRDALDAYDARHGIDGALRTPGTEASTKKKAHRYPDLGPAFDGSPEFDKHRVYVGEVASADDATGTFDVHVGTAVGSVRLADFDRYNPAKLAPSVFAPVGARVRVSLLAPVAAVDPSGIVTKVPLRLESGPEGALVAIDVRTRQIVALVGSYEAATGSLDRATQARRQPGSTFKPIVYSYAIHSRRFTAASLIDVNPAQFESGYRPTNYEGWGGKDPLRLRDALAHSVNLVAVRVLQDVGAANVVAWGSSLGIASPMRPDLSLALGSYEVKPIELAGAYATFAAGGLYDEPFVITRIVGPDGKDVELPPRPPERRVLEESEAYVTTSLLGSVIDYGTGQAAKSLGRPVAGKTGTSNQSKDTWFAGYSPDLATVTWVGYDDAKPLGAHEEGATTALPAWVSFMKVALEGKARSEFPRPAGVDIVTIDKKTGKLPYDGDTDVMDEVFLPGTAPTDVADAAVDAGQAESLDAGLTTTDVGGDR